MEISAAKLAAVSAATVGALSLSYTSLQQTQSSSATSAASKTLTITSEAAIGSAAPIIFNATDSARPGDVVTLQGSRFGSSPQVLLQQDASGTQAVLPLVNRVGDWVAFQVPATATKAIVVRVMSGNSVSAAIRLNAAKAFHADSTQIVPGGTFRLFGRNLLLAGYKPIVTIGGQAAEVQTGASNEHMLTVVAPAGLGASSVQVAVDNGNGSGRATADFQLQVAAAAAADPFGLPVGWTALFAPFASRVVDVACNGQSISQPVRDAIDRLAQSGGGTVRIGAGNCMLDDGIGLRDNIILQGAGKAATMIRYTRNYPLWAERLNRVAVRDLTLLNAGSAEEGPLIKGNRSVVLQNVDFRFGTSRQSFLTENQDMAVVGCDFVQASSINQQSPYLLNATTGLYFAGNMTSFVMGAAAFERVSSAYIQNNTFIRDAAAQNQPGTLHMMTIDFASRIAVVGNSFRTQGGAITNRQRNDGESILTEGGGGNRTENIGTVASATATTVYDPATTLKTDPFGDGRLPANYGIAIVSGTGAGQTRYVTGYGNKTITVDRPWDVVPDSTSRYATFVWGLEKAVLERNDFSQMPRGIWLYQAAIRDVDVVGNQFHDSGGIYLRSYQELAAKMFDPIYNIRIADNAVADTAGAWPAYMTAVFVNHDAKAFGIAMTGLAFRNNDLTAFNPNLNLGSEEYAGSEGYFSMMRVENYDGYESSAVPRVLGTIFQNDRCVNCAVDYRVGTGAGGTVIFGARRQNSATLWDNWKTTVASELATGTVVL